MLGLNLTTPLPGLILMSLVLLFGVLSFILIIKHKDRAILLILTSILGLIGLIFIIGELAFTH
jgi:hypothetical protein